LWHFWERCWRVHAAAHHHSGVSCRRFYCLTWWAFGIGPTKTLSCYMFQFACRFDSVGYIVSRHQQTFLKLLLIQQLLVSCHSFNIIPAIFLSFDGALSVSHRLLLSLIWSIFALRYPYMRGCFTKSRTLAAARFCWIELSPLRAAQFLLGEIWGLLRLLSYTACVNVLSPRIPSKK
jgi:hypothetical protein